MSGKSVGQGSEAALNQDAVRHFWRSRANSERLRWSPSDLLQFDLERVLDSLGERRPTSILDVGCGDGELLVRVLDHFPDASATAVDAEPSLGLHFAENERIRFFPSDATMLRLDMQFDLVLAFGLTTYLNQAQASALYSTFSGLVGRDGLALVKHQVSVGDEIIVDTYSADLSAHYAARYPSLVAELEELRKHFGAVEVVTYPGKFNPHATTVHCMFRCWNQ